MTVCESCGQPKRNHRSDPAHRLFFAVIAKAFSNWPEAEKFQPASPEDLRAFLLVKIGYCDKLDLRCDNPDAISLEDQLKAILRAVTDKPTFLHTYPFGVRLFWPRSLSYAAADRRTFNEVSNKVYEILEQVLGVSVDALKREAELEAA